MGLALLLSLPKTLPVLKEIPERLVMTEADAAQKKPALPDPEPAQEETPRVADSGKTYTDGINKGSSRGYGGDITVEVTVAETRISKVDVLSAPGETSQYLSRAKGVIDTVLQAQTWEVDTVSGATYSSRGILGAIQNALTGEKVDNAEPPKQKMPSEPPKQEPFDDTAEWKDGVYIGSARGFGGTIRVQVTISGGKIAKIEVFSHSGETDSYYNRAKAVISRIIKAGTPNVDTVSGATYSSTGIINAVKDALKKAAAGNTGADEDADSPQEDDSGQKQDQPRKDDTEDPDLSNGLKDGTYTTDVVCTDSRIFDYTIRLTMAVKKGKIQSITAKRTDDRSDDPDINATYLGYAVSGRKADGKEYKGVISQIIAAQSTKDVDIVSGATYSSNAILRGVKKLLAQAAKNPDPADVTDDEEENSGSGKTDGGQKQEDPSGGGNPQEEDDPAPEAEDGFVDGTYTLEAVCTDDPEDPLFDYTVLVTMKVEGGAVTALTARISEDRSDDPSVNERYFDYAVNGRTKKDVVYKSVIAQILENQSANHVDTVSGATWSSRTIINAVKQLMQQAAKTKTDEESGSGTTGEESETGKTDEGSGSVTTGEESGTGKTDDESGTGTTGDDDPGKEEPLYLDGTYSASVLCTDDPDDPYFYYAVKVTIKVEDGKITKVTTERRDDESEDPSENESYMKYATEGRTRNGKTYPGIPDQILDSQSASGLDAVSGATYSSRAIIEAAKKAVSDAKNPDA